MLRITKKNIQNEKTAHELFLTVRRLVVFGINQMVKREKNNNSKKKKKKKKLHIKIAPQKNTFQSIGTHQNSLKKYISKLLSLKRFLLIYIKSFFTKFAKK